MTSHSNPHWGRALSAPTTSADRPENRAEDLQGRPLASETAGGPTVVAADIANARAAVSGAEKSAPADDVSKLSDLLARLREFPMTADDAADLIIAAIEGKLAPAPSAPCASPRKRRGRSKIDDRAAVMEVDLHVAAGVSAWRACVLVARSIEGQSVEATARRLARKRRLNKISSPN